MKDKRILDNKMGIEIATLIIGMGILAMGLLEAISSINYIYIDVDESSYYEGAYVVRDWLGSLSSLWVGISIVFIGTLMIVVASLKMTNIILLKKSVLNIRKVENSLVANEVGNNNKVENIEKKSTVDEKVNEKLQSLRSEILYAQKMLNEELLSAEEFEILRKELLNKIRD